LDLLDASEAESTPVSSVQKSRFSNLVGLTDRR
jgi:hypothetical protein